ncbi:MAG: hypothetical protein R2695_13895 [Acidimicrobiales bacterium]
MVWAVRLPGMSSPSASRRPPMPDPTRALLSTSPCGKAVLGLTPQRLLVFGHGAMSGKPKGLNAAIPIDQVTAMAFEQGKMTGTLRVTFSDDTSIEFDVMKTVKPGPFVEAFHATTGR